MCHLSDFKLSLNFDPAPLEFLSPRLTIKCQLSPESKVSNLNGGGPRFNPYWDNILLLDFFLLSHSKDYDYCQFQLFYGNPDFYKLAGLCNTPIIMKFMSNKRYLF